MGRKGRGKKREYTTLTPYQGKKRSFGYFRCLPCEKEWSSANSWANTAQRCDECRIYVYPHAQHPLKKGRKDPKIRHPEELCGKCQELGECCIPRSRQQIISQPQPKRRRNRRK